MRKTKIIGTVGPSSMDYSVLKKMVLAGLDVVRINLSHAKQKDMDAILRNVKKLRTELGVALPIILDTRGPEIRIGCFKDNEVYVKKGQSFIFTTSKILGDNSRVSITNSKVVSSLKIGNNILACDGMLKFKIVDIQDNNIITKALNSGNISNNKSLFFPGVKLKISYLNDLDKKDILWGIKNDIDYVAGSFVNSKLDVLALKRFISSNGGDMKIISKIESQCGVDNLDEIIDESDAIMVARGDLGVEVKFETLPELQSLIILKSRQKGKPVITATEMLESMISSSRPTRAEVSDIANAVFDGTSCVMLSGETASGNYPIEAVKTMSDVAIETEKYLKIDELKVEINSVVEFIAKAVVSADFNNVKTIICYTDSGITASLISRYQPKMNIVAVTPNKKTYRQLGLLWGVRPILVGKFKSTDEMFNMSTEIAKKYKLAKIGENIIVTCGTPNKEKSTNLIKLVEMK